MKPRSAPVLSTGDGFTLIELLIVLGIIAVLIGFAVPEWRGQIIAKQVDTASSNLLHHLTLARNVSIQTGLSVLVCPASRTLACELDAPWSGGWFGFIDKDQDRRYDPEERIIFAAPSPPGVDIYWRTPNWIRFRPQGDAWPNGHFRLCSESDRRAQTVIVYLTGRVRLSANTPDGQTILCRPAPS